VIGLLGRARENGVAGDEAAAGGTDAGSSRLADTARPDSAEGTAAPLDTARPGAGAPAGAVRIELPRVSEIMLADNLYTLLWASVTPRGAVNRLRLRLRFINESRYPVYFTASMFRLAMGDRVLVPVDGPDEVVPPATIEHDAVTFDVPRGVDRVTLRVLGNDDVAELPLDLTPVGPEEAADTADPGDALSQAIRSALPVQLPETLLAAEGVTYTMTSATLRRFANVIRLGFGFRFENGTRYSVAISGDAFRLLAGTDVLAPVNSLAEVGEPDATRHFDVVFEVPPDTRRVTLRLRYGEQAPAERSFELPPGPSRNP
jgi:hypothetical protein